MDRGIATEDNVKYLKENQYSYIVIRRENESEEYRSLFENGRETFTRIAAQHRSVYGDENHVYVKRIDSEDPDCCCRAKMTRSRRACVSQTSRL
jgi:transposase